MKLKELMVSAEDEFSKELECLAKEEIKGRLREIHMAELTLKKMKKQLTEFLERDIDGVEL